MNDDTKEIDISECFAKDWKEGRWGENEHQPSGHEGSSKMYDTVWQPRQYVQDPVFVLREDVTQIGAIENVLECRKDLDPDGWSIFAGDESELICQRL